MTHRKTIECLAVLLAMSLSGHGDHGACSARIGQDPLTAPAPDRLALVIGISNYPTITGWRRLPGAVADATRIRDVLVQRFGFDPEHVGLLTDDQATRNAILDAFDEMVEHAGPDTLVVFFYAGHGSQLRDRDEDEDDFWDETLVPYDSIHKTDGRNDILDDELGERFYRLTTPHVVGLFDCCHSGTAMRGDPDSVSRFVASEGRGPGPTPTPGPQRQLVAVDRRSAERQPVILTACEDHQEARESTALGRGLFSLALEHALLQIQPDATWHEVHARVRAELQRNASFQDPVLHGKRDAVVFDSRFHPSPRRFSLLRIEKGRAVVGAGQMQGVHEGCRLLLRPYDESDGSALEMIVENAGFSESTCRPLASWKLERNRPVAGEAYYAELQEGRPPDFELSVTFAARNSDAILEAFGSVERDSLLRPPIPGDLVITEGDDGYEVFHEGHRIIPHPLRLFRGSAALRHNTEVMLDDLRAYATWNAVRRITNPGSTLQDLVEVEVDRGWGWRTNRFEPDDGLWQSGPLGEWQVAIDDVNRHRTETGDDEVEAALRLTIHSHHDRTLYFAVFDLLPDWSVAPVLKDTRVLEPHSRFELILLVGEDPTLAPGSVPERVKLFFTDRPESFWLRECRGIRDPDELEAPAFPPRPVTRGPDEPEVGRLAGLLDRLRGNATTRSSSDAAEPYLWTTKEIEFSVVPRGR